MHESKSMALFVAIVAAICASIMLATGADSHTGATRPTSPAPGTDAVAPTTTTTTLGSSAVTGTNAAASPDPAAKPWGVVRVDGSTLTVESKGKDYQYALCASVAPGALAGVHLGDFVTIDAEAGGACLESATVDVIPPASTCNPAAPGGYTEATWLGYNATAHTVVYQTSGYGRLRLLAPWCQSPTVMTDNGAQLTLAQVPLDSTVRVVSSAAGVVTEIVVVPKT
jgi:hypothetical protein